jgi:20S proteasome subunit alpha 5
MFLTRTEYDRGVNTFSPEGRLFQVEYAIEAIKLGSTAIGIRTDDGCVLVSEKRITSPLLLSTSVKKIHEIESHLAVAVSGLIADSMTMVDKGRVEATTHSFVYEEPMPVESLTKSLSNLALQFGDDSSEKKRMSRPFGVAVIVAGIENGEPRMFHLDPSGTYTDCSAKAIGSASEGAMQQLEEQYHSRMTIFDAAKLALSILKDVMEEKLSKSNVEVWQVTKQNVESQKDRHVVPLNEEQIQNIIASL